MHYSISTDNSITLFGFLSSLAFNNRIENLTLITNFRGPLFSGGPEAVPLLPPGRAGPVSVEELIKSHLFTQSLTLRTVHLRVMSILSCW